MMSTRVNLCVSAERDMMLVVRMTTTGVMSRAGLTLDEMDDMKMAVDEACNLMMLQKPVCRTMCVTYEYTAEDVTVSIHGQGVSDAVIGEETADHAAMMEVVSCILESMVDEVDVTPRADGGTEAIRMVKKIPPERRRGAQ